MTDSEFKGMAALLTTATEQSTKTLEKLGVRPDAHGSDSDPWAELDRMNANGDAADE